MVNSPQPTPAPDFGNAATPSPMRTGFSSDPAANDDSTTAPDASFGPAADEDQLTPFLKLLRMMYQVPTVPLSIARLLQDVTLDETKPRPTDHTGKLYAKFGDISVEITQNSILTDAPMIPALAYKMAAAAAFNPHLPTLALSGSTEERVMLFLAAKHFGKMIDPSTMPNVPKETMERLAREFCAFEQSVGLTPSTAQHYLTPAPAPTPRVDTYQPMAHA